MAKDTEPDRFVLMVAYQPAAPGAKLPLRGQDTFLDVADARTIEKACWRFMERGAKAGLFHATDGKNENKEPPMRVVENYCWRGDPWTMTAADGTQQTITRGTWLVGAILRPDIYEKVKKGEISGASIQGRVRRVPARRATLAQYTKKE